MAVKPFATVGDYEDRYGEVDDLSRIETLLSDATAYISSQSGFALREDDEIQAANLTRVTCAVVHRSLSAGDFDGLDSYSEGGIGYNASVKVYNPSGDFYLTRAEKLTLGIGGGRIGQTCPYSPGVGGTDV